MKRKNVPNRKRAALISLHGLNMTWSRIGAGIYYNADDQQLIIDKTCPSIAAFSPRLTVADMSSSVTRSFHVAEH